MMGMMRKGEAAVGGMDCPTSVFTCSDTSLHTEQYIQGLQRGRFYFSLQKKKRKERKKNQHGKEDMLKGKRSIPVSQNRTAPHLSLYECAFLQGRHIICFKGRKDAKPKPYL